MAQLFIACFFIVYNLIIQIKQAIIRNVKRIFGCIFIHLVKKFKIYMYLNTVCIYSKNYTKIFSLGLIYISTHACGLWPNVLVQTILDKYKK